MKTGSRVSLSAVATAIALCGVLGFSSGCVVAATGTNVDTDDKSQTQQLDTTESTGSGNGTADGLKVPDNDDTKSSGGQGGGPDPSPWRETIAAENGGPNGPDPSPWDSNPNAATNNTRK